MKLEWVKAPQTSCVFPNGDALMCPSFKFVPVLVNSRELAVGEDLVYRVEGTTSDDSKQVVSK